MTHVRPGHRLRFRIPRGELGTADAPFTTALKVGERRDGLRTTGAIVLAVAAHVTVGVVAFLSPAPPPKPQVREIPIAMSRPPPPPPVPQPEPPKPQPPPRPQGRPRPRTPQPPAQAAPVVTARPDPSQPVEMTNFTMPTGEAESFSGGYTSGSGTGTKAVMDMNATPHAPPAAPPSRPSLARPPAKLSGEWNCAWPGEEEGSDRNAADATIDIQVNRDGEAEDVKVLQAPNPNFAAAAKACPFQEHFQPALDDAGNPVAGVIHSFVIHFIR